MQITKSRTKKGLLELSSSKTNKHGLLVYKPDVKPKTGRKETLEQKDLNSHCKVFWPEYYDVMFHPVQESGSGGSKIYGSHLNSLGRKKGVPDWFVMVPSGKFYGLILELKKCNSGSVSKEQTLFMVKLEEMGYRCVIAFGFAAALKAIDDYLTIDT